jgi:hypothetical protein
VSTVWIASAVILLGGPVGGDDAVAFSPVNVCFKVERPTEKAFRTAEEWEAFNRAAALRLADGAPPIDFEQKMVVAHFDGSGSACVGFTVEKVEIGDNAVTVRATRSTSPHPCIAVVAYPQVVLEVPRKNLPVRFRIRNVRKEPSVQPRRCSGQPETGPTR